LKGAGAPLGDFHIKRSIVIVTRWPKPVADDQKALHENDDDKKKRSTTPFMKSVIRSRRFG